MTVFEVRETAEKIRAITWRNSIVGVATHSNADPDALASLILACHIARNLGARVCTMIPEGLSKASKKLINSLGLSLEDDCSKHPSLDICIIVDSSNPAQLGDYAGKCLSASKLIVFDHHVPGELAKKADILVLSEDSPSTTELLVETALELEIPLDNIIAELAMAGIIYDSRRFAIANQRTFEIMSSLLKMGGGYKKVLELLRAEKEWLEELSERIAILKALSRIRLGRACGDLIIAVTHIGSHESLVSKILIELGADIALVVVEREDVKRISVRVSKRALDKRIDASMIAVYLASRLNGQGGGHREIAMTHLRTQADIESIVEDVARIIPGKIGRICREAESSGAKD